MVAATGRLNGVIQAFPVFSSDSSTLPLLTLSAISTTPDAARDLARRHLRAFRSYLEQRQTAVEHLPTTA